MKQRTINTLCLLLAVAGISFGAGQTVGQDRAEAGATAARVIKVKDTDVRFQLHTLMGWQKIHANQLRVLDKRMRGVEEQAHGTCRRLAEYSFQCPNLTAAFLTP